jgi:HD-GYP domain-containing protein (c-di-GMP phosphodiesterase class II)
MTNPNKDDLTKGLQRSQIELTLAYDATLEGFARALDLREREPVGHTLKVTEYAVRLARILGVPDGELVHIRRGALLHDIGKMGIPESILQKPGPLTDEEWKIVCTHPQIAYDLLSPVVYLYPAVDIPYCHHEKWDGTGYPRGLRGEQIPKSARIFVVVDIWEALTTDRPFRRAWTEEKAIQLIQEQSGLYFDPEVVQAFMNKDFRRILTTPYLK